MWLSTSRSSRLTLAICSLLLAAGCARAQVIGLQGGDSTISQAYGAQVSMYLGDTQSSLGIGEANGHLIVGASETVPFHGWTVVAGDRNLPATLPSDFGGGQFGFYGRGISVERDRLDQDKLFVFAGVASQLAAYPMFYGISRNGNPTSVVAYERTLSDRWTINSYEVFSQSPFSGDFRQRSIKQKHKQDVGFSEKQTAIQSLSVKLTEGLRAAVSAGVGNNATYAGGTVDLKRKHVTARVGYAKSAPDFRLVTAPNTYVISNVGLNATVTVLPYKWLGLNASQFGSHPPGSSSTITNDNVGASLGFTHFSLSASGYVGRFPGQVTTGQQYGGGLSLFGNHLSANTTYSVSDFGGFLFSSITERMRHWSVTEYIRNSSTGTSVNVGGSYTSNTISASIGYTQEFMPAVVGRNPFATVLTASLAVHCKGVQVAVATLVNPGEKPLYTLTGSEYLYGPISSGKVSGGSSHKSGKYSVKGIVVDEAGDAVPGAAVKVGNITCWSNGQGEFQLSQRKPTALIVSVDLEEFTTVDLYVVVEAPASVNPTSEGAMLKIVLKKSPTKGLKLQ
jgi:hypothetical protein